MKQKFFMVKALVLGNALAFGQSLTHAVNEISGQKGQFEALIKNITDWILALFGLIALIRLIMIFTSQGSGEEKISKAGTWFFVLIFVVVGYGLSVALFKRA